MNHFDELRGPREPVQGGGSGFDLLVLLLVVGVVVGALSQVQVFESTTKGVADVQSQATAALREPGE